MGIFYKLPINGAVFYLVHFYPGCRSCVAPPGIIIRSMGPRSDDFDYYREAPDLPALLVDGAREWNIKCGMDPDEFVKAVSEQAKDGGFGKSARESAHDLADMIWDEVINQPPKAVPMERKN